jgi:transcription antitermination factor NusG
MPNSIDQNESKAVSLRDSVVSQRPIETTDSRDSTDPKDSRDSRDAKWHVLWVRSHCEQQVHDQLAGKGFQLFLPRMDTWARRNGTRYRTSVPMFPGYVFVHHVMDKASYIAIRKTSGLVKLLGEQWDRLAIVPDREIQAIQKIHNSRMPALPHPYLREGLRVRITHGLLTGAEGILLRTKPNKGLLVVSVDLLQRSVAVELDCTLVRPA